MPVMGVLFIISISLHYLIYVLFAEKTMRNNNYEYRYFGYFESVIFIGIPPSIPRFF